MKIRGTLTGRFRFRPAWSGVVLEVEFAWHGMPAYSTVVGRNIEWRRADMVDLLHPALRRLLPQQLETKPDGDDNGRNDTRD